LGEGIKIQVAEAIQGTNGKMKCQGKACVGIKDSPIIATHSAHCSLSDFTILSMLCNLYETLLLQP